jgi:hypothetical protein
MQRYWASVRLPAAMAIQRWMTLVILGVNCFLITVVLFIGSQLPTMIVIRYRDYASARFTQDVRDVSRDFLLPLVGTRCYTDFPSWLDLASAQAEGDEMPTVHVLAQTTNRGIEAVARLKCRPSSQSTGTGS